MKQESISQLDYYILTGDFVADGKTVCDVHGCDELAICQGSNGGLPWHPSCAKHANFYCLMPLGVDEKAWFKPIEDFRRRDD